ncbi:MAG: hypothetical protein ACRDNZ_19185 [Streptosporangiaceae bacterium]
MIVMAVLGDFLDPAAGHIAAAVTCQELPDDATAGTVRELSRVITALAGYLADHALPDGADPAHPQDTPWRITARTRIALRRSALSLRSATEGPSQAATGQAHPVIAHLTAAADQLAAGRDLLQRRLELAMSTLAGTPDSPAALAGHRYWAAVAASPSATAALLAEITGHARTLAPWTSQLTRTLPDGTSRLALHDATRWLYTASGTATAWQHHQALPPDSQQLLHDIPVILTPPRHPPAQREPVPALCEEITVTASRLRHVTVTFAPGAASSPAASSLSWRRHALAAAITTHASYLILRSLATRATELGADPDLSRQLDQAQAAARNSWPAWQTCTRQWDHIATADDTSALTPMATEIDDLVLRTGRLAYRNHLWTPAAATASRRRPPAQLAPGLTDITTVIAALHHASDALHLIAAGDLDAVHSAAHADRLWVPTWLYPDGDQFPYRYWPCPRSRITELRTAYRKTTWAARDLTTQLDKLAIHTNAPSQALAAHRRNSAPPANIQPSARDQDPGMLAIPDAGQVEHLLHDLHITEPAMLTRAQLADAAALDLITEATQAASRRHTVNDPSLGAWQHRTGD